MNAKQFCLSVGGVAALLTCAPAIWSVYHGTSLNPLSYLLWSTLSLISAIVGWRSGKGGFLMSAAYAPADFSVAVAAYLKGGEVKFGGFEKIVLFLVVICATIYVLCEWRRGEFTFSIIMNATALTIAGVPLILDFIEHPRKDQVFFTLMYLAISSLVLYGEKSTLSGKLNPATAVAYWSVCLIGMWINH